MDFQWTLQGALGKAEDVRDLTPKVPLENVDLGCLTKADEVTEALKTKTALRTSLKVHMFGANDRSWP